MDARALEGIEEIAEQTSLRVNERSRRGKFGWGVSPNIARASVAREQKKAPQKKAPRKRVSKKKTPKPISAKSPPSAARAAAVGQLFTSYSTLIETCRVRCDQLELSRAELDRLSGLPDGYSSKLLGRDGCGQRQKRAWPVSLEALLGALGFKVILIIDEQATATRLRVAKSRLTAPNSALEMYRGSALCQHCDHQQSRVLPQQTPAAQRLPRPDNFRSASVRCG